MNLVERIKNILLQPRAEWEAINAEGATVGELYKGFIIPLAAIGPVASVIGMSIFGITVPFAGTYHVPLSSSIAHGLVSYLLTLGGTYVVSLIINALAPSFQGEKDSVQALKVAAYASTASWLGGVFSLVPVLGIIGALAGLYGLYLLYLGLPIVMKSPQDKALMYTVTVVIAAVIIFVIIGAVAGTLITYPG